MMTNNWPFSSYHMMKVNVDATRIIQEGLAICDIDGASYGSWEFNFNDFDESKHSHHPDSIQLLKDNGIDFERTRLHISTPWNL